MKLSKEEQEVNISFSPNEGNAVIYTSYPSWIRKMDKLVALNPAGFKCIKSDSISKTYVMPKEFISIRTKKRTMHLTEEQKAQLAERLAKS